MDESYFLYTPVVFLVGGNYHIMMNTTCKGLFSVEIAGERYSDAFCGVVRSETLIHRVIVPCGILDGAREYTVAFSRLDEHVDYYNKPFPEQRTTYKFTPTDSNPHMYMICDSHGYSDAPSAAALRHGQTDVLVLGGDIGESSDTLEQIMTIYKIAGNVTGGTIPVVYVRGNHDTRGEFAEKLGDYIGTDNGNTYFTFRLGNVWGVVLDAGEDKLDGCPEYGGVADYTYFRRAQTDFLKKIIENKHNEYAADGVEYRIALCHMAFTRTEKYFTHTTPEIYSEWIELLNKIGVQVMLCGHCHEIHRLPDGETMSGTRPDFPVDICSTMNDHPTESGAWIPGEFTGSAIDFCNGKVNITFTNSKGEIIDY